MKKSLIVLLALCFFVFPVMAQTSEDAPVVTKWEDLEEDFIATGYSGTFYTITDLGMKLLVPGGLESVELSEESIDRGFAAAFMTEDESVTLAISLRDLECETLRNVAELAISSNENIKFGGFYKINEIDSIMLYNSDTDELNTVIPTSKDGYFIQISLSPIQNNEEVNKLSRFVMGSIQLVSEEE